MTVCAVFQFTRGEEEYEEFFQILDEVSEGNFRQITDQCILLSTILTPRVIRKRLLPCLAPDDRLFLSGFGEDCCGQLPKKSRDWLKANVFDRALPPEVIAQLEARDREAGRIS